MNLLPVHDFVTIYISHLEIIGSLGHADFPNADPIHDMISKKSLLLISWWISKKPLLLGVYIPVASTSFSFSNFHLKAQIL